MQLFKFPIFLSCLHLICYPLAPLTPCSLNSPFYIFAPWTLIPRVQLHQVLPLPYRKASDHLAPDNLEEQTYLVLHTRCGRDVLLNRYILRGCFRCDTKSQLPLTFSMPQAVGSEPTPDRRIFWNQG